MYTSNIVIIDMPSLKSSAKVLTTVLLKFANMTEEPSNRDPLSICAEEISNHGPLSIRTNVTWCAVGSPI